MRKTRKRPRFWGEFLEALFITLCALGVVIYELTKEPLILILTLVSVAILIPGILYFGLRDSSLRFMHKFKIRKWWLLGFVLLWVAFSMIDWIWVKLCLVLLAGGFILKDTIPRRDRSDVEPEE